jgi:hypothetical protein
MRICDWVGHKRPAGYLSQIGYGHAYCFTTDGVGVEHWRVVENCERCGCSFEVAKFHKKEASNEGK